MHLLDVGVFLLHSVDCCFDRGLGIYLLRPCGCSLGEATLAAKSVWDPTITCTIFRVGERDWQTLHKHLPTSTRGLATWLLYVRGVSLLQAGSLEFLAGQGFDFNKFVYEGIPFMRAADRDRRLAGLSREPCRSEISIHKTEDVEFVASLVQQVSSWLKVRDAHSGQVGDSRAEQTK